MKKAVERLVKRCKGIKNVNNIKYAKMEEVINDYFEANGIFAEWKVVEDYGQAKIEIGEADILLDEKDFRILGATEREARKILKSVANACNYCWNPDLIINGTFIKVGFDNYTPLEVVLDYDGAENLTKEELEILEEVCNLKENHLNEVRAVINSLLDEIRQALEGMDIVITFNRELDSLEYVYH